MTVRTKTVERLDVAALDHGDEIVARLADGTSLYLRCYEVPGYKALELFHPGYTDKEFLEAFWPEGSMDWCYRSVTVLKSHLDIDGNVKVGPIKTCTHIVLGPVLSFEPYSANSAS